MGVVRHVHDTLQEFDAIMLIFGLILQGFTYVIIYVNFVSSLLKLTQCVSQLALISINLLSGMKYFLMQHFLTLHLGLCKHARYLNNSHAEQINNSPICTSLKL